MDDRTIRRSEFDGLDEALVAERRLDPDRKRRNLAGRRQFELEWRFNDEIRGPVHPARPAVDKPRRCWRLALPLRRTCIRPRGERVDLLRGQEVLVGELA